MLVPDISKCWVLFLISALLSLALQKISCFDLTALSSTIRCKNALCVAGHCHHDIAAKTHCIMCVMTLPGRSLIVLPPIMCIYICLLQTFFQLLLSLWCKASLFEVFVIL